MDEQPNAREYVDQLEPFSFMELRVSEEGEVSFGISLRELFEDSSSSNGSSGGGSVKSGGSGGSDRSGELRVPAKRAWRQNPLEREKKKSLLGPDAESTMTSQDEVDGDFYLAELFGDGGPPEVDIFSLVEFFEEEDHVVTPRDDSSVAAVVVADELSGPGAPPGDHVVPPFVGPGDHVVPPLGPEDHVVPPLVPPFVGPGDHVVPPLGPEDHVVPPLGPEDHVVPPLVSGDHVVPPLVSGDHVVPLEDNIGAAQSFKE